MSSLCVKGADGHNGGSHQWNLIYLVCYCSSEQGQSIGKPQLSFWVLFSTPFSEREGFKKKKGTLGLLAEVRGGGV